MKFTQKSLVLILIVLLLLPVTTLQAQEPTVTTTANLNVRSGPSVQSSRLGQVAQGTAVTVQGRNEAGDWLFIQSPDGSLNGWVSADYVEGEIDLNAIPVGTGNQEAQSAPPPPSADPGASVLPPNVIQHARTIFQRGQELGNVPNSLIKIGDSASAGDQFNPTGYAFLCAFSYGAYELGGYGYMQGTVDYFNQRNAFCQPTIAAQNQFSSPNILDPSWADPQRCQPNESPLECDYRLRKPSVAIIYLGRGDLAFQTPEQFGEYLNQIVDELIQRGVIPVLNTFTMGDYGDPDAPPKFNNVIRQVAANNQIPLIDFAAAAASLPNGGTIPGDDYHLTTTDTGLISFKGDQHRLGSALRHLLTLQVLHELVTQVYQ